MSNNKKDIKPEVTHFATFGGSQLAFTKLNPMSICAILPGGTEGELREALQQPPFDNKYCTTYPISEFERMESDFGMYMLTLDEIRNS